MNKTLPDKWIRKSISDLLTGLTVDLIDIPVYDTRVTRGANSDIPEHYILMTSQSNQVDKNNKCEWFWDSQILLDIVTSYDAPGNPGSRVLADDILEAVRGLLDGMGLDAGSGLEIITQTFSFPDDISTSTKSENIFRKMMRIELKIK